MKQLRLFLRLGALFLLFVLLLSWKGSEPFMSDFRELVLHPTFELHVMVLELAEQMNFCFIVFV